MHNDGLHKYNPSFSIVRVIKARGMKRVDV
jgi:hypothetical protein